MSNVSSIIKRNISTIARTIVRGNRSAKIGGDTRSISRRNSFRRLLVESLEARQLMATDVVGTVIEDLNRNGALNPGEDGLSGWTVYLDLNFDNSRNTGEPSAVTNNGGDYKIRNVVAGIYRVAVEVKAEWIPTSPVSLDISVVNGVDSVADFYVFAGGEIAGTVWNDIDNDGIRATDPGTGDFTEPSLANWTVYLDLDGNRTLSSGDPSTLTDSNGNYLFADIPAGEYEVIEDLPAGWEPTQGYDWRQNVFVTPLQTSTLDFANFSSSTGNIQGIVFNDSNADGIRNTDSTTGEFLEPGLKDWTVYLDDNEDSVLNPGETSTTTNELGQYFFLGLDAKNYRVVEILPTGWDVPSGQNSHQTVTVEGGLTTTAEDFANFSVLNGSITGQVWNDINRNGLRDIDALTGAVLDPPLVGWSIFLDLNRNTLADSGEPIATTDADGRYLFSDLQIGEYVVREILPGGWEVATTFSESESVVVFSGAETVAPDFANYDVTFSAPGTISGFVWLDSNLDGSFEFGESGLSGRTVYIDQNGDSTLSTGEPTVVTSADGSYTFSAVTAGTIIVGLVPTIGYRATAPSTGIQSVALSSGENQTGVSFGQVQITDASISGFVFSDSNKNGTRDPGERGLSDLIVYLDLNNNNTLDIGEPTQQTLKDLFYTPSTDEAGSYSFTHLAGGNYVVRTIVTNLLSATPATELVHSVTLVAGEDRVGVNTAAVFRRNEIHGVKFEDLNGNHLRDPGEPGMSGWTIFLDLNRNNSLDSGEPTTITDADGSYAFLDLGPGRYVVREIVPPGYYQTSPTTVGGILWPEGTSNPAIGNVSPVSITTSLAIDESYRTNVSLTLPSGNSLTNLVDVFLLFDDTGSFTSNSPIVRSAFPDIIAGLQSSLPGIDLGFGVGRFEEYGDFAFEYNTGRPFILNQPIVAASTSGYMTAIQAALNRTTPGYGGDGPETDIEALYQLVTGRGFDGNNNGLTSDSGPAGLSLTQLNPGISGDVPAFSSFTPDLANSVLPAAGNIGGAGFRAGALPIVLLATDIGIAYQPKGESVIVGAGGVSLPISALTQDSRPTTPFASGAGIQETVTGLNALGALVIGLGTNPQPNVDPRQQLEALSKLTGAVNNSTTTIANGTTDEIAPGDPFYFEIASGFGASVANGISNAISNAVTNVAVDIELRSSDPRVHIINHSGIALGVGAGSTATFDVEFIGDGAPRRFDLQFVRAGTNVVLGSIPIVLGTPIPGDGHHYDELEDGEFEFDDDFSDQLSSSLPPNSAPTFVVGSNPIVPEDNGPQLIPNWATSISAGPGSESTQTLNFIVANDNAALFLAPPSITADGTLAFQTSPNAFGSSLVTVRLHDNGGTANGGQDTSAPQTFTITAQSVNDAPNLTVSSTSVTGKVLSTLSNTGTWSDVESDPITLTASLGNVIRNADGTWSWSYTPSNQIVAQTVTITANDGTDSTVTTFVLDAIVAISKASVYYKGATNGATPLSLPDSLDTTKQIVKSGPAEVLLSYANIINAEKGINGLVFDVAGLVGASLTAADFGFRVSPVGLFDYSGTNNRPSNWLAPSAPSSISVIPGTTTTPARVVVEWSDLDAIKNRWLQIRVKANANTGLQSDQVYYVGHLAGEVNGVNNTGNPAAAPFGRYQVTAQDVGLVQSAFGQSVSIESPFDLRKDSRVTAPDVGVVRGAFGRQLTNIRIPASGDALEGEGNLAGVPTPQPLVAPQSKLEAYCPKTSDSQFGLRHESLDLIGIGPRLSANEYSVLPAVGNDSNYEKDHRRSALDQSYQLDRVSVDDFFSEFGKKRSRR